MREQYSENDEQGLDNLFQRYRESLPDPEPSAHFMPELWAKIDARHTFSFTFGRLSRMLATLSAALCLVLAMLNLMAKPQVIPSYTDALLSDDSPERTYYTEAIRSSPSPETLAPR